MLNDPKSHGLWERTSPPAPPTNTLETSLDVDVAIVGGGYTGLSAALHLAESGTNVVLLEAKEIGFGGAGRNVGLINAGLWVLPEDMIGQLGATYGERLLDLLGHGPAEVMQIIDKHAIECELERQGTLHCGVGDAGLRELEQRATQWHKRGAPVELLDSDQAAEHIGSTKYTGALLDKRAGTLQPLAYARGLARAVLDAGVKIFTNSQVLSMNADGGRQVLKTPKGEVRAQWVIVATDAYGEGCFSCTREEQVFLPYFNLATKPLGDNLAYSILPKREGAWDTKQILSSFRMDKAGRLVFGSVGALRNSGASIHKAWARKEIRRLFPQLGDVEFEQEWFGMIGMTNDAMPRFHKFAPNVIGFSGYNGRGIAPGTVFGRVLASYVRGEIQDKDLPLPVTSIEKASMRKAKQAYYELGAQIAHLPGALIR